MTTRTIWQWLLALATAFLLSACNPVADIIAPTDATVGVPVEFSNQLLPDYAAGPDNHPRYEWDFGDGTQATGPQASHAYEQAGEYTVVLRIRDDQLDQWGFAYESTTTITVHANGASTAVNAETGAVVALPNGASIDIPANAMSGNATVSVQADATSNYNVPAGFAPMGEALVIDLGGASLNQPIDVSLPAVPDLPAGKVLALFTATPPSAVPMTAGNSGIPATSAIGTSGNWVGIPMEAIKGGTINIAVTQPGAFMLGAVDAASVGGQFATVASNPKWSQLPGTTETACSNDADFRPLNPNESPSYLTQLHSRHVACSQREENERSTLVLDTNRLPKTGYFDLKHQWSIHGASNRLSKRMSLQLRYDYVKTLSPPVEEVPVPALKMRAVLRCFPTSNNNNPPAVNCNTTQDFTLSDGVQATKEFSIPFSWDSSKKIAEFRFELKLYFSAEGTTPTDEGRVIIDNLEQVTLRCDVGQVWGQESGCVFPQASAVLVLNNPQSEAHIREAIAANPALPGQYTGLRAGSRAIAERSFEPSTGLQRLRVTSLIKANRAKAQKLCSALPSQPPKPSTCPDFSDPDTAEALTPCDCDEYPFASSREGAALPRTYGEASVKYISRADNRSAGAKLGAFLRKERLIDPFDHRRMVARVPPPNVPGGFLPDQAYELDQSTLNLNFIVNLKGYSSDFEDQYWIAY
ncbi:PKD domain-containing protein [Aquabacterium sp.]|uniref:PKD domain-containing protein n=1 Tax=Aquabacterium sp. TaxID=1872578 RepID=UPI0024892ADE|nr:PKD domain-containing protein [Aquabacterium sp.]MDI1349005.1 PKD domain-containing protein [Aquabacterium sp.]